MDAFITRTMTLLFSEVGLVGALLVIAIWWLLAQLKAEKAEHRETMKRVFDLAEKQNDANSSTALALTALRTALDTYELRSKP